MRPEANAHGKPCAPWQRAVLCAAAELAREHAWFCHPAAWALSGYEEEAPGLHPPAPRAVCQSAKPGIAGNQSREVLQNCNDNPDTQVWCCTCGCPTLADKTSKSPLFPFLTCSFASWKFS